MILINKTDDGLVLHAQGKPDEVMLELAMATAQMHIKLAKDTSEKGLMEMAKSFGDVVGEIMIALVSPEGKKHVKDMSFSLTDELGKGVN